jgi:hypothetical protein
VLDKLGSVALREFYGGGALGLLGPSGRGSALEYALIISDYCRGASGEGGGGVSGAAK